MAGCAQIHQEGSMNQFFRRTSALLCTLCLTGMSVLPVAAEDYKDEEAWYKKCTQVQTSREGVLACQGFQTYQEEKKEKLNQDIAEFTKSIDELSDDSSQIEALLQEQKDLSDSLSEQIESQQAAIDAMQASIADTQEEIEAMQKDIDVWDVQIKERMRKEQSRSGTNSIVDLIMGSTSLIDMLRRVSGLERITASDQTQIEELNVRKRALHDTIAGQEELIRQSEADVASLQEQKELSQVVQDNYQKLVDEYEDQIAELQAQKRSLEVDKNAIKDFVISFDPTQAFFDTVPSSKDFIDPVPAARISAGTWAYGGGGLHLGLDMAAPVGSDLLAPASGVIIYASNNQPSTGGYLGNWSGMPYGSGNYIQMLCKVDKTLYSISFSHLSNTFYVKAGDIVKQGQVMALTGNAGNSTGPHTHIEVYNLGDMDMREAYERFDKTSDFAFGSGWGSANKACEAGNSAPCRERPEKYFSQPKEETEKAKAEAEKKAEEEKTKEESSTSDSKDE